MLAAFTDQIYQPWPEEFPRRYHRRMAEAEATDPKS